MSKLLIVLQGNKKYTITNNNYMSVHVSFIKNNNITYYETDSNNILVNGEEENLLDYFNDFLDGYEKLLIDGKYELLYMDSNILYYIQDEILKDKYQKLIDIYINNSKEVY